MPDFDDALTKAYKALKDSPSAMRHVVIVSDGDPHPPGALLKRAMVQARITVSTVCIHPHEGDLNALQVMQDLATVTGGRAYFPKQPEELPGILIREAAIVKRNFIKEELFRPVHAEHSEILKGLPAGALPPLRGRVVCTEKPTAAVPLRSPEGDPVLAHWRFGLGRSVAFTSDAKNRWASEWVAWPDFPKFWGQAASWCLRTLSKNNFRVAASVEGGKGKVAVDALDAQGAFVDGLAVEARTVTPSSKTLSVPLKQTGPGRYEGEFDAVEVGTYPVAVSFSDPQGNAGALAAGMALSYSPEFRTEGPDLAFLAALAEAGGGKVRAGLEGVFDRDLPSARSPVPQWHVFLIAAAFLFLLDVFHRRVAVPYERAFAAAARVPALAFRLVAGRLAAPPAGRDATLETLLRKKADVAREREAEAAVFEPSPGTPGVAPGPARAAPAAGSGAPGSGGARAEKPPPPAEDPPFTKRLLDAKKRAWKKEDEAK
jgi:Ca-activated chloride channel family protein